MAGGLFELRRDDITGWWVAVVVDREFELERFSLPARRVETPDEACQNCATAPLDHPWVRTLKPQAFTVAGGERDRREREASHSGGEAGRAGASTASTAGREHQLGLVGDVGS